MIVCSACGAVPAKNHDGSKEQQKGAADEQTEEIAIPASLLKFSSCIGTKMIMEIF